MPLARSDPSVVTDLGAPPRARASAAVLAWAITLLAAGLPQILASEVLGYVPRWVPWAEVTLVAAAAVVSALSGRLRVLRDYLLVLLVTTPLVHPGLLPRAVDSWLGSGEIAGLAATQIRKLAVVAALVGLLLLLGYRRRDSFMTIGRLDAPAQPVRFLFDRPVPWTRLGPLSAVCIALGVAAFVIFGGSGAIPSPSQLVAVLPTVLILSAVNAFSEEVAFRAGPLGTLVGVLGRPQVLLLVAAYFGIAHYFGVPSGLIGVAMAGFFGWWVAKSAVESGGLFWPWAIHLVQDIVIFSFMLSVG
jgi:membrane protease YdiL (CAAX protease family)